jgi:hypothetical protein
MILSNNGAACVKVLQKRARGYNHFAGLSDLILESLSY